MYVCVCHRVTDTEIRNACDQGATSLECLQTRLKVATCCGRCKDCANELLHESNNCRMDVQLQSVAA